MTDFGSSFRKHRESKGLTLERIATETRISTRFLEAIEREEFHLLPGGIFSRGFIRAYAEAIGLDPETAVADFERISNYREPVVLEGLRVSTPQPPKSNLKLYPIAGGILVLVIAIFYIVNRERSVIVPSDSATVNVPAAPAPTISDPATVPEPSPQTMAQAPQPAAPPPPVPPPTEAPKIALILALEVSEPTWVKITTDGTSAVPGEILQPGTVRRYTAQNSIYLAVGNAGGLTLKINDQPMRPLGRTGQVRSITITPEKIKDIIG